MKEFRIKYCFQEELVTRNGQARFVNVNNFDSEPIWSFETTYGIFRKITHLHWSWSLFGPMWNW